MLKVKPSNSLGIQLTIVLACFGFGCLLGLPGNVHPIFAVFLVEFRGVFVTLSTIKHFTDHVAIMEIYDEKKNAMKSPELKSSISKEKF